MQTIAATEVRNTFGQLLNRVHKGEDPIVIEKLGIPVAALISMREYETYRKLRAQQALTTLGEHVGKLAETQRLTEKQLAEALKKTRRAVFRKRYGHSF